MKYLNYLTGIANCYLKDKKESLMLRMIVIYTADITREQMSEEYNIGALNMHIECAVLSELDSEGILGRLKKKVENNERLDDEELMEFIILSLSYRTKEEKQQAIQNISRQIVIRMIKKDYSSEEIAAVVFNYSLDEVEALQKELAAEKI